MHCSCDVHVAELGREFEGGGMVWMDIYRYWYTEQCGTVAGKRLFAAAPPASVVLSQLRLVQTGGRLSCIWRHVAYHCFTACALPYWISLYPPLLSSPLLSSTVQHVLFRCPTV